MSAEPQNQNHKTPFKKMSGAGNSFVIFDARKHPISLTPTQIKKISDPKNIGCDQLIILKNHPQADCEMEIYNSDGSKAGACGNATRCVASLFNQKNVKIKTAAGVLECWRQADDLISVKVAVPKFLQEKITLFGFEFSCLDVGNPHAVTFISAPISDEKFFEIGPKVENHELFPQKTNVEFAQILSDDLIEVRVWERGAGETLACGTGACAVGIFAIKNKLVSKNKVTTRFRGGDLMIEWNGDGSSVVMVGGYKLEFDGELDLREF